ncbi:hypothetical protein B1992_05815 [Pseudoxanthomonas broegbernensis]|uniref:Lipoprotein n=1 Tax=Pseudoxanthomonas broegbernensis TaxID=83619 RepID=A0A7V8GN51_9GAMM|nr:hypothetical protein [Pseudoxanthomonas broegbernensis]KAF1686908.1 hypothetical protein B1992_05815 [Pseudoxanthomonas broegbernensis]MBB6065498.1 hypothetical protein [Pseudoxanthomonas broegbernensis]
MKMPIKARSLAGLALVLALGGCSTYGYVDQGGGYYTGQTVTRYSSGSVVYPYGYSPGLSYGLGYYTPYLSPYATPYRGGYYSRPPVYRPPHVQPPRPGHNGPPTRPHPGHGGPPPRPPADGHRPDTPRQDGAPWRNLERLRRGEGAQPPRPQYGPRAPQGNRSGVEGPRASPPQSPRPADGMRAPRPPAAAAEGGRIERAAQVPVRPMRPSIESAPRRDSSGPVRAQRPASTRTVRRDTPRR